MTRNQIFLSAFLGVCAIGVKIGLEPILIEATPAGPTLYVSQARFQAKAVKDNSLGFDTALSGLLWIRLLQNARHTNLESDKVSWEFVQLDAITSLDPNFEQPYSFGAAFLSVFLRDNRGAEIILEKWAHRYPTYWRARYTLGYHQYFEMGKYKTAADNILKAASLNNAPDWLTALGLRLLSETGSLLQALRVSLNLYEGVPESGKQRVLARIRSLRFNLMRLSWTQALEAFRKHKKTEPADLRDLVPYYRNTQRELASFFKNESFSPKLQKVFMERFAFRYNPQTKMIDAPGTDNDLSQIGIYVPQTKQKETK